MKAVTHYKCDWCTKVSSENRMKKHEENCRHRKRKEIIAYKGVTKITKRFNYDKAALALWSEIVKANAGYVSEISGATENLNSHHIFGKSGKAKCLRYALPNGICITAGEHNFQAHGTPENAKTFINRVKVERMDDYIWCMKQINAYGGGAMKIGARANYLHFAQVYRCMKTEGKIQDTPASRRIDKLIEEEKEK